MDEMREIESEALRSIFSMRIYSDRLKSLVRICPDDGEAIRATGEMYRDEKSDYWMVEYYCPVSQGMIRTWQPDVDTITKQIAADVLGKAGANSASKL